MAEEKTEESRASQNPSPAQTENADSPPLVKDEKRVTVEIQKEYDALGQAWENRVFVKIYVAARTSGLLKKISDREFKTLIALSLYMDENGDCYPSQDQIAKDLGVSRETANRRIRCLLKFRFEGKPVVNAAKLRDKSGIWENVRYTILPVSQVKIFKKASDKEQENDHVTKSSHGPCDDSAMWRNRHTNKNQSVNKINFINVKEKIKKRTIEKESLAHEIANILDDQKSLGFFRQIVDLVPEEYIFQALSEAKDAYLTGRIKKNKAALFTSVIQKKASEHKIELNIKKA